MKKYFQEHEKNVKNFLAKPNHSAAELLARHEIFLSRLQHERLIHLLVTLTFGLMTLLVILMYLLSPAWPLIFLALIFLIMSSAYVRHYYFLENTTQRWYVLADELRKKASVKSKK